MNNKEKQFKVENFLTILKERVEASSIYNDKCFKSFIIAGSYADWKSNNNGLSSPSWKSIPDINAYIIIKGTNEEHLIVAEKLIIIYKQIMKELDFNILLDLHPFYKSYSNIIENQFNLQLTTRVLNTNNLNNYPNYCWFGWKSNYFELSTKQSAFLESIEIQKPKRDLNWLKHMYMAFSSYNNAVHMAILSSMFECRENVFDEIYRYMKEISKDGLSLAISTEVEFDYIYIKKWKESLSEFYEKYYNIEAKDIIQKIEYYEQDYFAQRKIVNIGQIASEFAKLLEIIYKIGFLERKNELVTGLSDEFFTLPLWY